MAIILVLHGPNLNLLGSREPETYGRQTLNDINHAMTMLGNEIGHTLHFFQSNAEHELINKLHDSVSQQVAFIIFNPAAFTHTSIALRDALLAIETPFIEIHLSNIAKREDFRHRSYFSDIAIGTISGLGMQSYLLALQYAHTYLTTH